MKKKILLILILPLIVATQCSEDDACVGIQEFGGYNIIVENTQTVYDLNETIWLNATVSSSLFNDCTQSDEISTDATLFIDSIFIVKLISSDTEINSEITSVNAIFDIGSEFNFSVCSNSINITPVISDDEQEFKYRLGIEIAEPGDYCIVSGLGRSTTINEGLITNIAIYDAYNNGDATLKFDDCDLTYTRTLEDALYFFTIE